MWEGSLAGAFDWEWLEWFGELRGWAVSVGKGIKRVERRRLTSQAQ